MTKRKKQALYLLSLSLPFFILGISFFKVGSGGGAAGLIISILITFGGAGILAGLTMLFTKERLGWFDSEPTPIFKHKKETEFMKPKEQKMENIEPIIEEEPIKKSGSESIRLMQREKELIKKSNELNILIVKTDKELQQAGQDLEQARQDLETKGWIRSENGWVIA
tara:strand:+ start:718 stop:1218 length:501 start_codon:yes stop_codon:yes gene_type:complete